VGKNPRKCFFIKIKIISSKTIKKYCISDLIDVQDKLQKNNLWKIISLASFSLQKTLQLEALHHHLDEIK